MGFEKPLSPSRDVPALSTYLSVGKCLSGLACLKRSIYNLCLSTRTLLCSLHPKFAHSKSSLRRRETIAWFNTVKELLESQLRRQCSQHKDVDSLPAGEPVVDDEIFPTVPDLCLISIQD